jgi:hypothetical protein
MLLPNNPLYSSEVHVPTRESGGKLGNNIAQPSPLHSIFTDNQLSYSPRRRSMGDYVNRRCAPQLARRGERYVSQISERDRSRDIERRRSMGDIDVQNIASQLERIGEGYDAQWSGQPGSKHSKIGLSPPALLQATTIVDSKVAMEKSEDSIIGSDLAQRMIKVGAFDSFPDLYSMLQLRMNTDFVSEEADTTTRTEWWK